MSTVSLKKQSIFKSNNRTRVLRTFIKRFSKNHLAVFGATVVLTLIVIAILAPIIAPSHYAAQSLSESFQSPSSRHWFGTDLFGRDMLSRMIYGARLSLFVGFVATGIGASLGIIMGVVAGYYSGIVENILMRIVDVILSIPPMLLAISIAAMLGAGLGNAIIAISVSQVGAFARIARASVLSVREQEYIEAVHALGARDFRIMLRHILPNISAPLIVQISLNVANSILAGAALSFIGLGIQPPIAEWGAMLSAGRSLIRFNWWLTVFPGAAIMLTVYGLNLMGDGLRDALDPRLKN